MKNSFVIVVVTGMSVLIWNREISLIPNFNIQFAYKFCSNFKVLSWTSKFAEYYRWVDKRFVRQMFLYTITVEELMFSGGVGIMCQQS